MKRDIQKVLTEELQKLDAEGVLCALSVDGEVSTYSAGSIKEEQHSTSFYIYSISKSLTAVAVMLLHQQGLLDLDDDLSRWENNYTLPEGVTIRSLLNHTSGLSDYFSSSEYQRAVHTHPEKPWTYEKLMQVGLSNTPLFEPGAGWMYSNPGYAILRELIEERAGVNYYDFINSRVLAPLGLSGTHPFDCLNHKVKLLAGVDSAMEHDFRDVYHPGWIATGCFISTVSDVAKFYQGLFSGRLLDFESLEEMKQTVAVPVPMMGLREPRYGLGFMSFGNDPQGENYGHGGGGPGYSNYAKHLTNVGGKQVTLVSVVNASLPQTPFDIAHRVLDCYLESL